MKVEIYKMLLDPDQDFLLYPMDLGYQDLGYFSIKQLNQMSTAAAKLLQLCPTLCDPWGAAHQLPRPWDSLGKNTGVGCYFLLQCMKVKSQS